MATITTSPRRTCRFLGCSRRALKDTAFCTDHIQSPEARELHSQLKSASDRLELQSSQALDLPPEDTTAQSARNDREILAATELRERRRRTVDFESRVHNGEYKHLLTEAVNSILDQAGSRQDFEREIGALRYTIANAIATETDSHRLGLTISRATTAWHMTRDPKPVVRYGEHWTPPYAREGIVHYIWRHRPEDFEERYLANLTDPTPTYSDNQLLRQIEVDHDSADVTAANTPDADGKYPDLPMPFEREWDIKRRDETVTYDDYNRALRAKNRAIWIAKHPNEPVPFYLAENPDERI